MDTLKRLHENISALADGELADSERELAFAALGGGEGQAAWRSYHLVGDVLRAEAAGAVLSDQFATRLAARLAQEPAYVPTRASKAAPAAGGEPPAQDQAAADVTLP